MSRSTRKTYPVKLNYIIRMRAGKIQKETGLPASLIHRLRAGKVKTISESTTLKLSTLYNSYWKQRAIKKGARPDEADSWIKADRPPKYIEKKTSELIDTALKIQAARRTRDANNPGYNDRWHNLTDILKQISKDVTRTAGDWVNYTKKVITGTPGKKNLRYTPARIEQWKKDNARYKKRRRNWEKKRKEKGQ